MTGFAPHRLRTVRAECRACGWKALPLPTPDQLATGEWELPDDACEHALHATPPLMVELKVRLTPHQKRPIGYWRAKLTRAAIRVGRWQAGRFAARGRRAGADDLAIIYAAQEAADREQNPMDRLTAQWFARQIARHVHKHPSEGGHL